MKPSGIGGQAVMEGVMMKNGSEYAVAVRRADQSIIVKKDNYHSISEKLPLFKVPFLRGIVNFIESLYLGMKTLVYSASFYEEEEAKRKEEWEEWISTGTGRNFTGDRKKRKKMKNPSGGGIGAFFEKVSMFFLMLCSFGITIALFMLLPMFLSEQFMGQESSMQKAVLEGGLRLLVFLLYVAGISKMEDIERVFMYHGAEHKTINCVENGLELTVENVRKQPRQHKRCGTSFLFLVIILSIVFFIFIRTEVLWQKIVFRLLLVPVIAAVSYEFIRLAGRSENPIVSFFSKPGMWVQNLTTREPDDDMIEVAICSVEAVFDWRAFLDGTMNGSQQTEVFGNEDESKEYRSEENTNIDNKYGKGQIVSGACSLEEQGLFKKDMDREVDVGKETAATRTLSETTRERLQRTLANDGNRNRIKPLKEERQPFADSEWKPDGEEDDAILKALDKFFGE